MQHLCVLDIIILLCFIPAAFNGVKKGFISQVAGLLALIAGVWISFHFSDMICGWLREQVPAFAEVSPTVLQIIAFALVLIVVSLLFMLVGRLLSGVLKLAMLGWLDKTLGLVFALLTAFLILGTLAVFFDSVNHSFELVSEETLSRSTLYPIIRDAAYKVFPFLKALLFKQ